MKNKLLIVDDEWNMRNLIKIYLAKENFQIDEAEDGREAIQMAEQSDYDLMVLDIMMPDMDGWAVCSVIRQKKQLPILMLTARNDIKDRVHGLNLGADDYLVKPFAPEELIARIHALLRRPKIQKEEVGNKYSLPGHLSMDIEGREIKVKEKVVELTPKEFDILYLTASQPKRVLTREVILEKIWHTGEYHDLRAVDTHVKNIREKLRKAGLPYNPIKTVWGVGYKFNIQED